MKDTYTIEISSTVLTNLSAFIATADDCSKEILVFYVKAVLDPIVTDMLMQAEAQGMDIMANAKELMEGFERFKEEQRKAGQN